MASTDAKPVPQKNVAYRHYFAIRDTAGALVTTWAGQDSEVSKDGGAYSDCTNEATEVGTSGTGYIDLTSTEMNADSVMLKVTVTNTDAIPYVVTLFPEEAGDIRANAAQIGGQTATALTGNFADITADYPGYKGTVTGTPSTTVFRITVADDIAADTLIGMEVSVFSSAGIPRGRQTISDSARVDATTQEITIDTALIAAPTVGDIAIVQ